MPRHRAYTLRDARMARPEEGKKEDMFRKICLKSVPFFVEEFHRTRKPAPLHRFLVHGQSSDDKQSPYAKF
ncbi:hypothetical protein EVAR_9524_1 [Eumeta japonica]|uniref:Uncharacterized protein n=1 Tax=Eumeta variegata TaxID=151549 RepID=A0A4C1U3I0_EUMVA|nr:hypothetical protein EVAR_9524_1 [Eumeta japonica]